MNIQNLVLCFLCLCGFLRPYFFLQARKNELAIEDMDGGTFTISNGGVFGSLFGTPIINPPQSAILGMHAIVDRPVAVGGKVGGAAQEFSVSREEGSVG